MRNYLDLLSEIRARGIDREGRNGGTRALFAQPLRFKMSDGFPAMTTKRLAFRTMAAELLWFIGGHQDNSELVRLGCNIWTANAEADYWQPKADFKGDLGRVYGVQWRHWRKPDGTEVDQLGDMIKRAQKDPFDRRLIVSSWNPGELENMALPPCHMQFQLFSTGDKLSLHMYQRSCDMFLGVPFNIASYALLLHILAQILGQEPDELVITLGDAHIYHAHYGAVDTQLRRFPKEKPTLWINPEIRSLDDLDTNRIKEPKGISNLFRLMGYDPYPTIEAEMLV